MKGVRERVVEVAPWSVTEYRAGRGEEIVVLVHGLGGSFEWFERIVDELAQEYTVCGIDLPGFGAHRGFLRAPLPLDLVEAARLLGRWIEGELERPVHLVGHSMGGQIVAELSAERPDLVATVTLISSTGLPGITSSEHIRRSLLPSGRFLGFVPRLVRDAVRAGPSSILLGAALTITRDSSEALRSLSIPVLVLWGILDQVLPPSYGTRVAAEIPGARLEMIEEAGHLPMWEAPLETVRLIREHLRSRSDPGLREGRVERWREWTIAGCRRGICWRGDEKDADVVLIHGLGIGSRYLGRLAAELKSRGLLVVAPDLPGFGRSWEIEAFEPEKIARIVSEWATDLGVERAVWLGHSVGAQVVENVGRLDPALVERSVYVSPIWSDEEPSVLELASLVMKDSMSEPPGLVREAVRSYWSTGVLRFLRAFRAYADHLELDRSIAASMIVVGENDPLVDREYLRSLGSDFRVIEGAHGIVWSHPELLVGEVFGEIDTDAAIENAEAR